MASNSTPILLHILPIRRSSSAILSHSHHPPLLSRRLLLSSPASFLLLPSPSKAEDIPLFGLRKKLKKIGEEAAEVVKEGEKALEEGIAAAEKEVAVAEEGIAAAEERIAAAAVAGGGGDLAQAGAVAGAEVVGVLVGLSVVNGILGPEGG